MGKELESELDDERRTKERLADILIRASALIGGLAYVPSAYLAWREGLWFILAVDSIALPAILLLAFLPRLPYALKIAAILALSYALGATLLVVVGPFGAGHLYLFCFVVLVGLFEGRAFVVAANLLCAASYAAYAAYAASGLPAWSQGLESTIVISANAFLVGAALSAAANYLVRRYAENASAERRMRRFRETMLREIDHRVKNNIQVIQSLVSLRSRPGADPAAALAGIKESLAAMSLVHQLLDRSETKYTLKAGRYLESLFARFQQGYPTLTFEYSWKGPDIEVDSDVGVDLGMMINEIVVNSAKHAFAGREGGRIFLEAVAAPLGRSLSLTVGDDGPGIGEGDAAPPAGQGRRIIEAIARHLGARAILDRSGGCVYRFELELPEPASEEPRLGQ